MRTDSCGARSLSKPAGIMLCFLMALKSKQVASDWALDCQLLEGTLRSIANQDSHRHRTIVIGHERPDIPALASPDVEFLQADWEPPQPGQYASHGMEDKWRKLQQGLVHTATDSPRFVMLMDADDRLSRGLVSQTERESSAAGFIIKTGYAYRVGSPFVSRFDDYDCGTNAIIGTRCFDFPRSMDPSERARSLVLLHGHTVIESKMASLGQPLTPLSFRAGMYVVHPGAHSRAVYGTSRRAQLKTLLAGLPNLRPLTRSLRSEFGMP